MKINKTLRFLGVCGIVFSLPSHAKQILEDATMIKNCSFLIEKSSNQHCLKEQKDELVIKQTSGKGFPYIEKNITKIVNDISTPIGLHHFVNELESKMLSASVLSADEKTKEQEFNNVKKIYKKIKAKNDKLNKIYIKDLEIWKNYSGDKEHIHGVVDFATNRIKLNQVLQEKLHKMNEWTKNKNYYFKIKQTNKDLILPLYMGQKIKASKEECEIIKVSVPNTFQQKRENIEGC